MSTFNLPGFEDINIESLKSDYEGSIMLNGKTIALDLHFEEETIKQKRLDRVKDFIDNISKYNDIALEAQYKDFNSDGDVKEYIEHHLELTEDDDDTSIASKQKQLLSEFYLKRIGFYPYNDELFAVFDYTIGHDLTDYLIVVNFYDSGHINYLTKES